MIIHKFRANGVDNYLRAFSKDSSRYIRSHDREYVSLVDFNELERTIIKLSKLYPDFLELNKYLIGGDKDDY